MITPPTLGSPGCIQPTYSSSAYSPAQKLDAHIDSSVTAISSDGTAVRDGDYIEIENERMLVTSGGGTTSLTVVRAQLGTSPAAHAKNKAILLVTSTGTVGTAAAPAACGLQSATVTLQPGTYYGGICIGATSGTSCDSNCDIGSASVTLAPGTYIMAGGGFRVCGSSKLSAPNVLIYNTSDPSHPTGAGAIDQVELNTTDPTGNVILGPQPGGPYKGLTIFQDPAQAVSDTKCDGRSPGTSDVALLNLGSKGLNAISGTVYAPHPHAVFADSVSGTANLAVFSGCIYIGGGDSTFEYQASGLFGTGLALSE
jgi:hypothetical protein